MVGIKQSNEGLYMGIAIMVLGSLLLWLSIAILLAPMEHDQRVTDIYMNDGAIRPNPDGNHHPLQYTENDHFYMTQALYYEAQNEPHECQRMVAHVIMARKYDWYYPNTVKDVIWQPKQFSYTHDGKPEHMNDDAGRFVAAMLAHQVLSGLSLDTTEGSLYYFNPDLANPDWKEDYQFVKACGGHTFYKRKDKKGWG